MVRQVFAWYAEEGATLNQVGRKVNASAWKPRRGTWWSNGQILGILHREWYVGRAYYNRTRQRLPEGPAEGNGGGSPRGRAIVRENPRSEWIPVAVPRLIEDAELARVQQRIEANRRFARRRLKRTTYLLKGLLKCGRCGHAFTGFAGVRRRKSGGRWEHTYYKCNQRSTQATVRLELRCTNDLLRGDGVDEVVWTTVRDLLLDGKALAQELNAWLARTATKETEQAELRSWVCRQELATHQAASARGVVERLRDRLHEATFEVKQAILRLVVERVVATGRWLEIHLALPVSGSFDLTPRWGAIFRPDPFLRQ